jgi:RNA polymerase sigma factor (sigma-70 family)
MINATGVTPGSTRAHLKNLMLARYARLGRQLERFVGSSDDAADALQETWLRLEVMPEVGLRHGEAYLLRMASNIAVDQFRRERRHFREDELDETFEVEDELADPERIVAARRNVDAFSQVLLHLPPRQQEILRAARIEGELNREIAQRLGISVRLVEKELRIALDYCNKRMRGSVVLKEAPAPQRGRRKY